MAAFMVPVVEYLSQSEAEEYEAGDGPGFYARLSAPGYLDCTEWIGPCFSREEALVEICDLFEVDTDGNDYDTEDYDDSELERIRTELKCRK